MDFEQLSREVLRALRGRRTQKAFSRQLGFRSNVANAWEAGRDLPRTSTFFQILSAVGKDGRALLEIFRTELKGCDPPEHPGTIGPLLDRLRGKRKIGELASAAGLDRFLVSRILRGHSDPRLPEFFRLLEALTLSCLDFLALALDVGALPECADRWRELEVARRAAYEFPWAQALVLLTDLPDYQKLPEHQEGWFAARIGLTTAEEVACLRLLVTVGRLKFDGRKYVRSTGALSVDTRANRDQTRRLASFWMKETAARIGEGRGVSYAFNVFGVSRVDAERLRELQRRYFTDLRAIVAASEPTEVALVAQSCMVEL